MRTGPLKAIKLKLFSSFGCLFSLRLLCRLFFLLGSFLLSCRLLSLFLGLYRLGAELHDYHGSVVALAVAKLHDTSVATLTISELTLSNLLEYLAYQLLVAKCCDSKTAGMQVALLCPGDDLVYIGADFLGARLNRLDAVVGEQRSNKALLHGLGMAEVSAKLAALIVVPHL